MSEDIQFVGFKVGGEEFGVNILKIQEIIRMKQITKVPRSHDFCEGVINLRGNILPVLDLRRRFGIETVENSKKTRIMVVNVCGRTIGIIVDEVSEVLRLNETQIDEAPREVITVDTGYVEGVGKVADRLLIILNLDKLLSTGEMNAIDKEVA